MAEGYGLDPGSIYGMLVGKTVSRHDAARDRLVAMAEQQNARLTSLEKGLAANTTELGELRQTVATYHASVGGNGITTSELEARVQRVEGHPDLPPFVHG